MKTKTMHVTTIFVVLLLMLAVTTFISPIYAAEDQSAGTATVGNADPVISAVTFTDTSLNDKDGAQIDVDVEYWCKATIDDDNGLTDIDDVTYKIWGPSSTEGGADSEADHYTFEYDQETDTWSEIGPGSADEHLVSADCQDPGSLPGDYRLAFKLGKIAERTSTATWTIKIIVTDDSAGSDYDDTLSFGVNYYSEITIASPDDNHGWTGLSAGGTDVVMNVPDGDLDFTVTSNADFDVQAKGSGDLTKGGDTIGLGNVTIHKDTLASSVSLTTSYADVGGLTEQTAGADLSKAFILWIDVPDPCPPGDYTYTLSVQIIEDV